MCVQEGSSHAPAPTGTQTLVTDHITGTGTRTLLPHMRTHTPKYTADTHNTLHIHSSTHWAPDGNTRPMAHTDLHAYNQVKSQTHNTRTKCTHSQAPTDTEAQTAPNPTHSADAQTDTHKYTDTHPQAPTSRTHNAHLPSIRSCPSRLAPRLPPWTMTCPPRGHRLPSLPAFHPAKRWLFRLGPQRFINF